jgi:uncharacterized Tic20 family protein
MEPKLPDATVTNWAMLAHLSAFLGFLMPFGNLIGPGLVWAIKGKELDFVATEAKEALNFQLTVIFLALIGGVLAMVLIGFLVLALLGIADIILIIVAAVSASNGRPYRYPFTLRLIK